MHCSDLTTGCRLTDGCNTLLIILNISTIRDLKSGRADITHMLTLAIRSVESYRRDGRARLRRRELYSCTAPTKIPDTMLCAATSIKFIIFTLSKFLKLFPFLPFYCLFVQTNRALINIDSDFYLDLHSITHLPFSWTIRK